jgi:hypothetical protein
MPGRCKAVQIALASATSPLLPITKDLVGIYSVAITAGGSVSIVVDHHAHLPGKIHQYDDKMIFALTNSALGHSYSHLVMIKHG